MSTLAQELTRSRIPGLDFIRAVAVLLVLIDHSGLYRIGPIAVFDGGFGVEMFFVLSGFLITRLLLDEQQRTSRISLVDFYRRRAARLLPVFYAYLVAGLLLLLLLRRAVPWGAVVSSAVYVVNYYQACTGATSHYLSHCWSLAVEEQFYLLWPPVLILVLRRGWSVSRFLTLQIVCVWGLRHVLIATGASHEYLFRALETRMDQLACGCLVAVLMREAAWRGWFERLPWRGLLVCCLVAAMLASLTFLRGSELMKYGAGYLIEPVLVAVAIPLVVLLAAGAGWPARLLNAAPMVLMGQVSYGMYLFHPFVIHPVRHVVERYGGPSGLGIVVSIGAVFVCAYLSFRFFETPLRSAIRGSRRRASTASTTA